MAGDKNKTPDEELDEIVVNTDFEIPEVKFGLPEIVPLDLPDPVPLDLPTIEMPDLDTFSIGEKLPPRQPNATAKQVAQWMKDQIKEDGYLYQEHTAYKIDAEFGDKFTYQNDNGNRAITKDVLTEFRKITPDMVWSRSGFYWRKRESHDDPKKRRVE